jgi:hypothetical protein
MSEKPKFGVKEDVNSQQSLLEAIKTANAYEMCKPRGEEIKNIAEKVRDSQGIPEGKVANLAVSVGQVTDDNGKRYGEERIWVQSEIHDTNNPNIRNYRYTPVASVFEGTVMPADGFVNEEALALAGMAEGLKEAGSTVLTRLSPTLTSIKDPTTAIMMLPSVSKLNL